MVEVLPVLAGKDREVTLKVTKGEGGGHDAGHTSPRPTGSLATHPLDQPLPGTAPARGICLSAPTGTTTATTDVSGKAGFVYTSCEIGGVETIKADVALSGLAPQRTLTATSTVTVAVPGLADIGEQPTYVLTGGTSRHPLSTNHFALPNTNMGVLLLAFGYVQDTGTMLEINDMSLPMGGLFDIDGDWRPTPADCNARPRIKGHCTHRDGRDVDLGISVRDPLTRNVTRDIPCEDDERLEAVVTNLNRSTEYPFPVNLLCEPGGRKHVDF